MLTACQHPCSHLTYATWWPRTLSRIPVAGGEVEILVPGFTFESLAIDHKAETLYLAEEDEPRNIVRTDLAGEHGAVIVPKAGYCPALAFDATHEKLYRSQMHPTRGTYL